MFVFEVVSRSTCTGLAGGCFDGGCVYKVFHLIPSNDISTSGVIGVMEKSWATGFPISCRSGFVSLWPTWSFRCWPNSPSVSVEQVTILFPDVEVRYVFP